MVASLQVVSDRTPMDSDKQKALDAALAQIDRAFGKGSAMRLGSREAIEIETISTGLARARHRARHRRPAARPRRRDLRPGKLGQDDPRAARGRRGAEGRRRRRLRRCRACARPDLRPQARSRRRQSDRLAARHGRAGARDHRYPGPLQRGRHPGHRFRRRSGAARRDRGRDGRQPCRPAGAADEPVAQEADRLDLQVEMPGHLHQPAADEDRRHVRQSGDDDGRQCAQILRLRPARHPPHRPDQGPRRHHRQHHAGEGRQEQAGAAVQAGRVRHHVRRGRVQARRDPRPRRQGRAGREIGRLVQLRFRSGSARAARTPNPISRRIPRSPAASSARSAARPTRSARR